MKIERVEHKDYIVVLHNIHGNSFLYFSLDGWQHGWQVTMLQPDSNGEVMSLTPVGVIFKDKNYQKCKSWLREMEKNINKVL